MIQTDDLAQILTKLPRVAYADLIHQVEAERRRAFLEREKSTEPRPGMSEAEFAEWIGRQHLYVDRGVRRVFHLPGGSPAGEVRLLEVNDLAIIPEEAPVLALDFAPDIEGIDYSLYVADVTPRQFGLIERGLLALPPGWTMADAREIVEAEE